MPLLLWPRFIKILEAQVWFYCTKLVTFTVTFTRHLFKVTPVASEERTTTITTLTPRPSEMERTPVPSPCVKKIGPTFTHYLWFKRKWGIKSFEKRIFIVFISAGVAFYSVFCTFEFACWFRQCQTGRNDLFLRVCRSRGFAKRKSSLIYDANRCLMYLLDVLWDFRFLLWEAFELNRCIGGGIDAFNSGEAWTETLITSVVQSFLIYL